MRTILYTYVVGVPGVYVLVWIPYSNRLTLTIQSTPHVLRTIRHVSFHLAEFDTFFSIINKYDAHLHTFDRKVQLAQRFLNAALFV